MKRLLVLLSSLMCSQTFAQSPILTGTQAVPPGKIWHLAAGREYSITLASARHSCIREGTYLLQKVAIIPVIETFQNNSQKKYSLVVPRDFDKKQAGQNTYIVSPLAIAEEALLVHEPINLDPRDLPDVSFGAGQQLRLPSCVVNVTLYEVEVRGYAKTPPRKSVTPGPDKIGQQSHSPAPSGTVYRVQILASQKPAAKEKIQREYGLADEIYTETFGLVNRYSVGNCKTYEEAESLLARVRRVGLKDAFIIGIKDGKRIQIQEGQRK